jgi:hypothetical protein
MCISCGDILRKLSLCLSQDRGSGQHHRCKKYAARGRERRHRWAYSELPPKAEWPTIFCRKIKFDDIGQQFPEDMPILDADSRQREIKIRQQHVQRRFRVF